MNEIERIRYAIPDDITLKIISSLQVSDICSLGSCSRFWKDVCGRDCIWSSLCRDRWPVLDVIHHRSSPSPHTHPQGWKGFYIRRHKEIEGGATDVIKYVQGCSSSESFEVGDLLRATEALYSMRLGLMDVQMFIFKPKLSVLLNLVGLFYCIKWLQVPAKRLIEMLQNCKISERQVCVKWWKLGRWAYGFRPRDESYSRSVSLADLVTEDEVVGVLNRGVIYEVLRVQISVVNPPYTSWSVRKML